MEDIETPLARACRLLESKAQLARVIDVSPSMVSQMVKGHRRIPAEHCPTIERATGGRVRCEDLRPDVDWGYLRGTSPELAQEAANA